jgi:hypothetical protein
MFPKPLDARLFRIASPVKGEVYHSTVSAHIDQVLVVG